MKLRAIASGVGLLPLYANIYLLSTPQGRVLFDTGTINHAPTFVRLLRAFDPQAVVISHSHIDHAGSAFLAARLGYPVLAHQLEHERLLGLDHQLPYPAGKPALGRAVSRLHPRVGAGQLGTLHPGEEVGGWEVVHLPGHTDGQIGLRRGGVLLAADAVLSHGGQAHLPRQAYNWNHRTALQTLKGLAELDLDTVLPGHGEPITAAQLRARAVRDDPPEAPKAG